MEAEKTYLFTIQLGRLDRHAGPGRQVDRRERCAARRPTPIGAALAGFVGEIEQIAAAVQRRESRWRARLRSRPRRRGGGAAAAPSHRLRGRAGRQRRAPTSPLPGPLRQRLLYPRPGARFGGKTWRGRPCLAAPAHRRGALSPKPKASTLDELQDLGHKGAASERLKPVETALDDIPALAINGEDAFKLRQGRPIVLLPHVVETLKPKFRDRTIAGQDASRAAVALFRGQGGCAG